MKSIIMLINKNIKKKLLQFTLIAIIIVVTATTFSTAIGIMFSVTEPFKAMYTKLNGSYDIIRFQQKGCNIEKIQDWWKSQDNVNTMNCIKTYRYRGNPIYKDQKLNTELLLAERPKGEVNQDKLLIIHGENKSNPEKGEVWIPTGAASKWNIKLSDNITLTVGDKYVVLKVSAIVVDPQFSSGMFDPVRFWLAPEGIKNIFSDEDNIEYHMGVTYKDNSKSGSLGQQFLKDLGTEFLGRVQNYSFIEYVYTMQYKIIAAILIVISAVIILIAIMIISFTIKNAVLYDYKTIGILKAQGFSNSNIIWCYCGQFSLVSLLATPLGILIGHFVIKSILRQLMNTVGITNVDGSMMIPYVITFLIIVSVVFISSYFVAYKTAIIKPAEAIRYGAPPKNFTKQFGVNILKLKRLSLSLALAIKQILTSKKQCLFMFLIIFTTIFMVTFMVNINNSLYKLGDNLPYWGADNSEIQLNRVIEKEGISNEELMKDLNIDKRIKIVAPNGYTIGNLIRNEKNDSIYDVTALVYEGNMDEIGLINIQGRNPQESNEVSLAINTSRDTNKNIGDYFEVTVKGEKKAFLVTGIYQTLNNGGQGFRIKAQGIKQLKSDYEPGYYSIILNSGEDKKAFIKEMKAKYKDKVDAKESREATGSIFDGLGKDLSIPLLFVAVTFIIVCFITIFNTIMINISEEKKIYGIYKALGFSSNDIRKSIIYKIAALTLLGLFVGVPLAIIFPAKIVGLILSSLGMVEFPFVVSPSGTLLALVITIILILISAWIPLLKIREIDIRGLIEE